MAAEEVPVGAEDPKSKFQTETTWIREYAKTYLPCEAGFSYSPDDLRSTGISLIQIRHVFRNGEVVFADKLDEPGAIWVVEGEDQDRLWLRLTVEVISETQSVLLREVVLIEPEEDDNAA